MHYFYGARAIDEVFFLEDFLELEKEFPNFHFHLALDRPDPKADAFIVWSTLLASLLRGGRHLPQATRRSRGHRITCAVLQWCPRLCLICSTLWALRTIWWWLMILAVAANNAFGYQGKRYAIGCLDSCKRILVVRARVFIMYGVFGIHFLASTTSSFYMFL